ncbi:MAG: DUF2817 domain-containing protein [Spirochaetales bacterium]|nr:DUF2817 domain-containing protein [Spirochaetales bacterium]
MTRKNSGKWTASILFLFSLLVFILFVPYELNAKETPFPPDSLDDFIKTSGIDTGAVEIGVSVKGRPIYAVRLGKGKKYALVFMACIHGNEKNTAVMLAAVLKSIRKNPVISGEASCYFIPVMNPDGFQSNTRFNANKVDLNRNFPTDDWKKDACKGDKPVPGSGGSAPGSEPEIRTLTEWLKFEIKPLHERVLVISFHAAFPPSGCVQPAYIKYGVPEKASDEIARYIASHTGYTYLARWVSVIPISGELLHWCAVNGIKACDIELPNYRAPDYVKSKKKKSVLAVQGNLIRNLIRQIDGLFLNF